VSHTLNLIAATDIDAGKIGNQQYNRMYNGTLGKCQALWNLINRSSKASDTVSEICEANLLSVRVQT